MQDLLMNVIGILVSVIVLLMFPLMEIAGKTDELSQTIAQLAVSDFVNTVALDGKITDISYRELIGKLNATGNTYNIQLEIKIYDDNPNRVTTTGSATLSGENKYYSVYTDSILNVIFDDSIREYDLKANDYIIVRVENTNTTMGSQLRNFMYNLTRGDSKIVETTASAQIM